MQDLFVDVDAENLHAALYISDERFYELIDEVIEPIRKKIATSPEGYTRSHVINDVWAATQGNLQEYSFCLSNVWRCCGGGGVAVSGIHVVSGSGAAGSFIDALITALGGKPKAGRPNEEEED